MMAVLVIVVYSAFADTPQPVLRITALGSNQFSVLITNGVATTNYTLFWTPALENPVYPWQVLGIGVTGETNFNVDANVYPLGFFRAMIGDDFDGDGVPEWKDGQPFNSNVGLLDITIDSPANGSTFN